MWWNLSREASGGISEKKKTHNTPLFTSPSWSKIVSSCAYGTLTWDAKRAEEGHQSFTQSECVFWCVGQLKCHKWLGHKRHVFWPFLKTSESEVNKAKWKRVILTLWLQICVGVCACYIFQGTTWLLATCFVGACIWVCEHVCRCGQRLRGLVA